MSLVGAGSLIKRSMHYGTDALSEDLHSRLGHAILTYLNSENPMLRRAAIQYCTEFHQLVGELPFNLPSASRQSFHGAFILLVEPASRACTRHDYPRSPLLM
jgi:hypothetical protein